VLLASLRFNAAVHAFEGSEIEKVAAAKIHYDQVLGRYVTSDVTVVMGKKEQRTITTECVMVSEVLQCALVDGGAKGVLATILSFV